MLSKYFKVYPLWPGHIGCFAQHLFPMCFLWDSPYTIWSHHTHKPLQTARGILWKYGFWGQMKLCEASNVGRPLKRNWWLFMTFSNLETIKTWHQVARIQSQHINRYTWLTQTIHQQGHGQPLVVRARVISQNGEDMRHCYEKNHISSFWVVELR